MQKEAEEEEREEEEVEKVEEREEEEEEKVEERKEEEAEEAVEWTRKIVRTYFTKQLSKTFSQDEIEEYILMLAEITGKTQMAKDASKLAGCMVATVMSWDPPRGSGLKRTYIQDKDGTTQRATRQRTTWTAIR